MAFLQSSTPTPRQMNYVTGLNAWTLIFSRAMKAKLTGHVCHGQDAFQNYSARKMNCEQLRRSIPMSPLLCGNSGVLFS
jgi:hypothetical protein